MLLYLFLVDKFYTLNDQKKAQIYFTQIKLLSKNSFLIEYGYRKLYFPFYKAKKKKMIKISRWRIIIDGKLLTSHINYLSSMYHDISDKYERHFSEKFFPVCIYI